jgi:hypothetical protein
MQKILVEYSNPWTKTVKNEKTMINFVVWYLKNIASKGEATTELMKYLQDHDIILSDIKMKQRRMGRILAMYPDFKYVKHYDLLSKMDKKIIGK